MQAAFFIKKLNRLRHTFQNNQIRYNSNKQPKMESYNGRRLPVLVVDNKSSPSYKIQTYLYYKHERRLEKHLKPFY